MTERECLYFGRQGLWVCHVAHVHSGGLVLRVMGLIISMSNSDGLTSTVKHIYRLIFSYSTNTSKAADKHTAHKEYALNSRSFIQFKFILIILLKIREMSECRNTNKSII